MTPEERITRLEKAIKTIIRNMRNGEPIDLEKLKEEAEK